jgi:hypothetical protein
MDGTTLIELELPNNFELYDQQLKDDIIQYIKQLTPIEKKAYSIGKQHLGSSFNVVKSNGFINWKKNKKT